MEPTSVRQRLLEGMTTDEGLAEALGCSVRTVYRLDLPYVKVGARRFYNVDACRVELISRQSGTRKAARSKGRPRKSA